MSKPSTNPGLGPPPNGEEPAAKKTDTVDDILDGFGAARADQPRILPKKSSDITPTPPDASAPKKELDPTVPGERQKKSRFVLATVVGFGAVLVVGLVLVKVTSGPPETPPPASTETAIAKATAVMAPTALAPIPTETAVPTASVDTAAPPPSASVKPTATAKPTASAPSAKPSATTTATGDAPGLHLIKGN